MNHLYNTPRSKATLVIELPNKHTIKGLTLEESYKYLGILQADDIKFEHVKEKDNF